MPNNTAIFGELSLAGEIRQVTKSSNRIKTAIQLGFTNIVCPEEDSNVQKCENIKEMVKILLKP